MILLFKLYLTILCFKEGLHEGQSSHLFITFTQALFSKETRVLLAVTLFYSYSNGQMVICELHKWINYLAFLPSPFHILNVGLRDLI